LQDKVNLQGFLTRVDSRRLFVDSRCELSRQWRCQQAKISIEEIAIMNLTN